MWKLAQNMKCDKQTLLLYAVTDRSWTTAANSLSDQVQAAIFGGVTCVQLREKKLQNDEFLAEALCIGELCRQACVPFIINDNVDIALKCGANGVHVGQEDMCVEEVRTKIGESMLLGVSVQTVEQAVLAEKNGADYLGVGAMFATPTKPEADVVPLITLRNICHAVSIPVVAIGGINRNNIGLLAGSGVDGVALVSAIFASSDISAACCDLRQVVEGTIYK